MRNGMQRRSCEKKSGGKTAERSTPDAAVKRFVAGNDQVRGKHLPGMHLGGTPQRQPEGGILDQSLDGPRHSLAITESGSKPVILS